MDNPIEFLMDQFNVELRQFDRTFLFSDDADAYTKGQQQLSSLKRLARGVDMSPEDFEDKTGHRL